MTAMFLKMRLSASYQLYMRFAIDEHEDSQEQCVQPECANCVSGPFLAM